MLILLARFLPRKSFGDKVLLFFVWFVQYPHLSVLGSMFGVSKSVISAYLRQSLPFFVGFFSNFIPNKFADADALTSHLSSYVLSSDCLLMVLSYIVGIIDGTVHKIRRPSMDQYLWWNDHYKCHAIHSLFLVSFTGEIAAVATGIPGSFHDSSSSSHLTFFQDVLGDKLVLGDPGFSGAPYVISGFKVNQIDSLAKKHFDRLSRSEQVKIEHVNNFVKKCKTLSDSRQFIHSNNILCGCVAVGAGFYNFMLKTFGKFK